MIEDFKNKYIEEVKDLLNELEGTLLKLENNKDNIELAQEVFRVMHTIKGTSGMYDFKDIEKITHNIESIYGVIRDKKIPVEKTIISITFKALDYIRTGLSEIKSGVETQTPEYFSFQKELNNIFKNLQAENKTNTQENQEETEITTYYILFQPEADIATRGVNIKTILDEVAQIGTSSIVPHSYVNEEEESTKFYMYWEIFLATTESKNIVEEAFLFVQDEVIIKKLAEINLFSYDKFIERIDQQLESSEPINIEDLNRLIELIGLQKIDNEDEDTDEKKEKEKPKVRDLSDIEERIIKQQTAIIEQKTTSIKVSSEKLDELMNLVSELVTTKAELLLIAEKHGIQSLNQVTEKIDKLSKQFKDNALNIRLVPIESMMLRFERLVRDLSTELGKKVDFITEGTDTELDKTIIDNLASPLMHIIRNSIDHGIESKERREELKKAENGRIKFTAFYSGANVFIQVQDDGAGINTKALMEKAIKKGFVSSDANLSEKEIYDLIFLPGFSMAQKITGVSGRGVGMDVVKQKILNLRGDIEIDSEIDLGTIVTIKLPLTLSIVDALLVSIGQSYFLIPLYVVDSCSQATHEELKNAVNQRLNFEDELIPFINLRDAFLIKEQAPDFERIVLIKHKDKRIGLIVDKVIGEHQAVLKSLGDMFVNQEFISGGSILGDGSVALILDTNKLIKQLAK